MKIDKELIEQALHNVAMENLMKQVREFIVYEAPEEIRQVYAEYARLLEEKENNEVPNKDVSLAPNEYATDAGEVSGRCCVLPRDGSGC